MIPAYNAEDTVVAAVHSVLGQTLAPWEVVVVDDGSSDRTSEVLAVLEDAVRVIRQPNGGLAAARTTGMRAASGELIAWLDADDLAAPHRLEVQAAVMAAEPEAVLVSSDFNAFGCGQEERGARSLYGAIRERGGLERALGPAKEVVVGGRSWRYHVGDARPTILFGNFLHPPSVMMRRWAAERVGGLNGDFPVSEDWLYFVELSELGPIAFVDEPLVEYRRSPDQMSSISSNGRSVVLNNLWSLEYVLARHPELIPSHGADVDRALAQRHRSVANTLAEHERWTAARHLARAVRLGGMSDDVVRSFAKIVLPGFLLRALRRARGRPKSGTAAS